MAGPEEEDTAHTCRRMLTHTEHAHTHTEQWRTYMVVPSAGRVTCRKKSEEP